jgi:hypothetical protein
VCPRRKQERSPHTWPFGGLSVLAVGVSNAGVHIAEFADFPQGSPLTITGNRLIVPIHPFETLTTRVDYQRVAQLTP